MNYYWNSIEECEEDLYLAESLSNEDFEAKLPTLEIPDENDPAFLTFMAEIIEKVKESIQRQTEEQKETLNKIRELSEAIALMKEAEQANAISEDILTLTKMQQAGIKAQFMIRIKEVGIKYDKEQKKFVKE